MNDIRRLYLKKYYVIDNIDHLLKNCIMSHQCHKYWHSPTNHGKALLALVAYDIYQECAEGTLIELLKTDDPVSFWEF
eukprot:15336890-Ditylum_brightwellii.AAC.1